MRWVKVSPGARLRLQRLDDEGNPVGEPQVIKDVEDFRIEFTFVDEEGQPL